MADEFENLDSLNEEIEKNDSLNVEETTDDTQVDDVEALKETNRQLFARAKKAEGFVLEDGKWVKKPKEVKAEIKPEVKEVGGLTPKDTIALITAKVTEEEDISEVENWAKFRGISVSEALKTPVIKTLLAERAEERKTAEATSTKATRRGANAPSEDLLGNAQRKGEMPTSDADILKLAQDKVLKNKKK